MTSSFMMKGKPESKYKTRQSPFVYENDDNAYDDSPVKILRPSSKYGRSGNQYTPRKTINCMTVSERMYDAKENGTYRYGGQMTQRSGSGLIRSSPTKNLKPSQQSKSVAGQVRWEDPRIGPISLPKAVLTKKISSSTFTAPKNLQQ